MLSKEKRTDLNQLPKDGLGVNYVNPDVRRSQIRAKLAPIDERLKCERDSEKRISLLIEHAELLKELCLLKNA